MLINYFKIAIAVLKRRKFFTFISLFGISLTLTIIIVLTAFMDNLVSPSHPDMKRERSLYVNLLRLEHTKRHSAMTGPVSFYFLDHYVRSMKRPEKVAIFSVFGATNAYVNNKKLVINLKHTNDAYWEVEEYKFLEGKPYTAQQIANADKVAVISEATKLAYFGDVPNVVGKYIETDNVKYRVSGVVKDVPITSFYSYGDMYTPYTTSKDDYKNTGFNGMYMGILLAPSKAEVPAMQKEYEQLIKRLPMNDSMEYNKITGYADRYLASFTHVMLGDESSTGVTKLLLMLGAAAFLFMLLPTINLVNINSSRIMERSSEIAVRKAFGASSGTLAIQFIVENLILTLLGGIIGIALSALILWIFNNSQVIPAVELHINITVLAASLLACLIFGLLSGVYPAWRMSRLQVVTALKSN
ncbi:ABC transporter permease [Chitinophaga niabensis]|uniref:Putative ABC transport system permease protein n=1 Tax=Chitinophaga niabensis TaxID=536979 RepID=A0A1N6EMC5_9BACT|nr:ABC transporter permease [Chitinophaga niabensis]SIN84100.1 putative ABC transport system permease protein [Chitinophaga niabensis]